MASHTAGVPASATLTEVYHCMETLNMAIYQCDSGSTHDIGESIIEVEHLHDVIASREITCDCQVGGQCEGGLCSSLPCCSYNRDPQTKVIWDLKAKIEELEGRLEMTALERDGALDDIEELHCQASGISMLVIEELPNSPPYSPVPPVSEGVPPP
tara:strand:- start:1799 stop:2266 length:468 start_codon:yes stop_codon:yes gene_type:complete